MRSMSEKILCLLTIVASVTTLVTSSKIDCYPIDGVTKEKCESLGCIWSPVQPRENDQVKLAEGAHKSRIQEPWCYFPEEYEGYKIRVPERGSNRQSRLVFVLERQRPSALGDDVQNLIVETEAFNDGTGLRIRIRDPFKQRFEPELPKMNMEPRDVDSAGPPRLKAELLGPANSTLAIRRVIDGALTFSTDLRRLIFSDRFIQLQSSLASRYLFGLGEHLDSFTKIADQYKSYSFWNSDRMPLSEGVRSYGGFPFYINFSPNLKTAFGVYLRSSNAMDVVLQDDPGITFRTIGGIIDIYIIEGPSPLEVVQQFQNLVGLPSLPPRWALGFQLCRFGYKTLDKTKLVWSRTREAGIPFDVQWNDIDYMHNYNDFTYDPVTFAGLPEFVNELHDKHNMRYIAIVDPGISQEANYRAYELGEKLDIWIKNATNQPLVGKVWNHSGRTVWPDFSNLESHKYWAQLFKEFHEQVQFDGAWIDMNDISNFVDGSLDGCPRETNSSDPVLREAAYWENPPYRPGGSDLQAGSLCLSAKHHAGLEYNVHNLYSFYEAIATHKAMEAARPGKRSLIISRSTHPGQGQFSGHWSGDILSNWDYLRWSIVSLLEHSMYGFSMMGSDICGFSGNTDAQLCARWSTLGAFYTFSRNHNDDTSIDQDPVALGQMVVEANKFAYTKKYSLLPYFYTLLFQASEHGLPVARPLIFQFFDQSDETLLSIESQFMVGDALMVAPIVQPDTYKLRSYLPEGRWYETDILPQSANKAPKLIDSKGEWVETENVALNNLVLFVRGSQILPYYKNVAATTTETANGQPVSFEVALCARGMARGTLVMDDGESTKIDTNQIKMEARHAQLLNLTLIDNSYEEYTPIGEIKVYGIEKKVSQVKVDRQRTIKFIQEQHMLVFDLEGSPLGRKSNMIIIEWE